MDRKKLLEGLQESTNQQYTDAINTYMINEASKENRFNKQTSAKIDTSHQKDKPKKKGWGDILSAFSKYGMDYDEDVYKNMKAVPGDKKLVKDEDKNETQDLFSILNNWKQKSNEDKNFFEKDFVIKREALRKLAMQPELEEILDTFANEAIVYDTDNTYIAQPFLDEKILKDIKTDTNKAIQKSIQLSFYKFYHLLGWKKTAWDEFKRFLIEGILSYEIVYDSITNPTNIIGIIPLDPATLTKEVKEGTTYWVQFKGSQGRERKMLDAQIIYVKYQDTQVVARLSYLERLIRPFNIYRIIEQAQIVWTVTNASMRTSFTIPVNGMNKTRGAQALQSAMQRYKEDISFNMDSGELNINGKTTLPFQKEYWFPESEAGKPEMNVIGGEGPELNDNDQLKYFKNNLWKMSKIPLSRFDVESGTTWMGSDPTATSRDEINFSRFIERLRSIFAQIIIKPIQIQLCLDNEEINGDKRILDSIQLQYNSYNQFSEMMEQDLMTKRVEFINTMKDSLVDFDAAGNEVKFFSSEFLVRKYLKMSDADLELNTKYKDEEVEKMNAIIAAAADDTDADIKIGV